MDAITIFYLFQTYTLDTSDKCQVNPVRCKSAPGFLVNRALLPYIFKAIEAVAGGEKADHIDEALVDFGMPMGPIELADQIGLDVCLDVGIVLGMPPAAKALLDQKCKTGTIGRKSGSGFYEWDGNRAIRALFARVHSLSVLTV